MKLIADSWPSFVQDLVDCSNELVAGHTQPEFWVKETDGTLVSELDVMIDLAVRKTFAAHYPHASLLSEELGWLRPYRTDDVAELVGVLDPVDGTESLMAGATTWWISLGILQNGVPTAGLLHQPVTGTMYDSTSVSQAPIECPRIIGMSPDQADATLGISSLLRGNDFEVSGVPHSAEKIAAVLSGRCSSAIYIPSVKSPDWRSWDLAAAIVLAREAGLILSTNNGRPLGLKDLNAPRTDAWVCSREVGEHTELLHIMSQL